MDTGLNSLKTASKKLVHKTGEFLGNKIADPVAKLCDDKIVQPDKNSRNVEEIIIRNIAWIKTSITKMVPYKISKLLNDWTVQCL